MTIPELRQITAYLDVSSSVIFAARFAAGIDRDQVGDFEYPNAVSVPPTAAQVDDLAAHLQANPVHNAPGRTDPVDPRLARLAAQEYGITVRIAAFPVRQPGEPFVDYAPELLKRFPGEVVMVAQGRWLDVAAADLRPALAKDAAEARRQADLAGAYVLVLGEFEAATTRAKLAAVAERLAELEKVTT